MLNWRTFLQNAATLPIAKADKGNSLTSHAETHGLLYDDCAVITWGLTDQYTWLANRNRRGDGAPVRVLPLDRDYRGKQARSAIAKASDGAGKRA